VLGATDRLDGEVRETPFSPKDILATAFHLLGIDPHRPVRDLQGKPLPVAGVGEVRPELIA
jgi:hypothetical protein